MMDRAGSLIHGGKNKHSDSIQLTLARHELIHPYCPGTGDENDFVVGFVF